MKFHKTLRISITVRRHFGKVFAILSLLTKSCSEFYGYNVILHDYFDVYYSFYTILITFTTSKQYPAVNVMFQIF